MTRLASLRLGLHYHLPAEERESGVWVQGFFGRFIDSLAERCSEVVCFLHVPRDVERAHLDYRVRSDNVVVRSIGPRRAAWRRGVFSGCYRDTFAKNAGSIDLLLLRGPSPLLPALGAEAALHQIPVALLIVGSCLEGIDNSCMPRWRKELVRAFQLRNQRQQDRLVAHSLTFVNSRRLYKRYEGLAPRLVETRTTTLRNEEFFERSDTCQNKIVRLLYTGRFDRAKGVLDLLEAVALLRARGRNVALDLVGWEDSGSGVEAAMAARAKELGVEAYVVNHGRKTVGHELFQYYRDADIYVLASRSEGFPRTIWEAMAHCVPVVATRVGSIPDYIEGAAVLVNEASSAAIADGVVRMIEDGDLRRRLIERAYAIARQNTINARADEMIEAIKAWQLERKL